VNDTLYFTVFSFFLVVYLFDIWPSCLNLCLPKFKNILPSLISFKSLEIIRGRTGQLSKDLTDDAKF
jgi:hypothetical protein